MKNIVRRSELVTELLVGLIMVTLAIAAFQSPRRCTVRLTDTVCVRIR